MTQMVVGVEALPAESRTTPRHVTRDDVTACRHVTGDDVATRPGPTACRWRGRDCTTPYESLEKRFRDDLSRRLRALRRQVADSRGRAVSAPSGPAGTISALPGPFGTMSGQPGPAGVMSGEPGPVGKMSASTGSAGTMLSIAKPAEVTLTRPGVLPSALWPAETMSGQPGSADVTLARAGSAGAMPTIVVRASASAWSIPRPPRRRAASYQSVTQAVGSLSLLSWRGTLSSSLPPAASRHVDPPLTSPEAPAVSCDSMTSPTSVFDASAPTSPHSDTTANRSEEPVTAQKMYSARNNGRFEVIANYNNSETAERVGNNGHINKDDAEINAGFDSLTSSCRDTDRDNSSTSDSIFMIETEIDESSDRRPEYESETSQRQSSVEDLTSGRPSRELTRREAETVNIESCVFKADVASSQSEIANRLKQLHSGEYKTEGVTTSNQHQQVSDADRCTDVSAAVAAAASAASPAAAHDDDDDVGAHDVNLSSTDLNAPPIIRPSRQLRRFDSLPAKYDVSGHVVLSSTRLVEKLSATLNALTVDCRQQQPGARNHDNGVDVTSRRHDSDAAAPRSDNGGDERTPEIDATNSDDYENVIRLSSSQTGQEVDIEVIRLPETVIEAVSDWMDSRSSSSSTSSPSLAAAAAEQRIDDNLQDSRPTGDVTTTTTMTFKMLDAVLDKGPLGLGFCIDGGRDAPGGPAPITVKRLFKGDTMARQMLRLGDELVTVNGVSLELLDHFDAWNLLKRLPDGPVYLRIRRPSDISQT